MRLQVALLLFALCTYVMDVLQLEWVCDNLVIGGEVGKNHNRSEFDVCFSP